jgi:hypothetical protein
VFIRTVTEGQTQTRVHAVCWCTDTCNEAGRGTYKTRIGNSNFKLEGSWRPCSTSVPCVCDTDLGVRRLRTKYMLMSRSQKVGQKHSIKIVNRAFEYVAKFKYLGTTPTDQNCTHEEIKSGLNSGNACCRSVHSLLSSRWCLGT